MPQFPKRTEPLAAKIKSMIVRGYKPALIAKRLSLSEQDLADIYGRDMELAHVEMRVLASATLFKSAINEDLASIAQILKTRAGWSETAHREANTPLPPFVLEQRVAHPTIMLPCNGRSGCPKASPQDWLDAYKRIWAKVIDKSREAGCTVQDLAKDI